MEKLLSDKWDNFFLQELKQEALMNARNNNESLREQAFYLYDNPKMENAIKSGYMVVTGCFPEIVLASKTLLVKSLESEEVTDKHSLIAKTQDFIKAVGSHPDTLKTPVEDFVEWAKQSGLDNIVSNLGLQNKNGLKM